MQPKVKQIRKSGAQKLIIRKNLKEKIEESF